MEIFKMFIVLENKRKTKGKKDFFISWFTPQSPANSQHWDRLKPGAWNFIQVCCVGGRVPEPSAAASKGTY